MPNGINEIKAAMERRSRRMPASRRAPLAPTDDAEARQEPLPPATVPAQAPAHVEQAPEPTVAALAKPDEEPTRQLTARLPLSLDDHLREFEHQVRRRGLRDLTRQELVRHLVASLPTGGAALDVVVSALQDRRRR
jgi:hypothetical protein